MNLTVKQAAEKLGLSPLSVYRLVRKKLITHARLGPSGGKLGIPEAAVEEYLARCTVPAREERKPKRAPEQPRSRLEC